LILLLLFVLQLGFGDDDGGGLRLRIGIGRRDDLDFLLLGFDDDDGIIYDLTSWPGRNPSHRSSTLVPLPSFEHLLLIVVSLVSERRVV